MGLAQVTRIDVKTLTGIKIVLVDRERRKVTEIVVREGQRGRGERVSFEREKKRERDKGLVW